MIRSMVQRARELLIFLTLTLISKIPSTTAADKSHPNGFFWGGGGRIVIPPPLLQEDADEAAHCLSWRLAVESGNARAWRVVPTRCHRHVEAYMVNGQYERDVRLIAEIVVDYASGIKVNADGLDAWVFDVDDTCVSNVVYYSQKRFGCDPYDPSGFRAWAMRGNCPAIPGMLGLFNKLIEMGFKLFLVTGRDEQTLGQPTIDNLISQGFHGYEQLILRAEAYKGQSAVKYKSEIRRQIIEQGYRIWGNVGDQWSDLQGECLGNRTFKIPNPMYFVP